MTRTPETTPRAPRATLSSVLDAAPRAGALGAALALALTAAGCGASVSPELVDARQAMQDAQQGPAARLNPDGLREAERTLQRAEDAGDGSQEQTDLAYIAQRKIRVATVEAQVDSTRAEVESAEDSYREELEEAAMSRQERLDETREALSDVREELRDRGDTLDARTRELQQRESELSARMDELMEAREARAAAEQRAESAMTRLRELAEVVQEQGETTITLNGEVLFETDEAVLRSTAERRLMAVVEALNAQADRSIVVEGHTDSRGSDDYNRRLSRDRAGSVRDFLVSHGVDAGRVEVEGHGESQPVADNSTPEGRANNRRVEIVLEARG